ncbi:Replicase polyprotein 1a [Dissostichus eleginoides]|uniref:Replicase polyprotein 1a n=1 Tax=Dissostichus eleginoides TaxID=100907 RepID=A0AAD9CDI2_DISEL|nr:Replicase polyprotein 1a [Dissostichus eleginoides]
MDGEVVLWMYASLLPVRPLMKLSDERQNLKTKENFGRKEDPGQIPSMSTQTLMTNRVAMLKEDGLPNHLKWVSQIWLLAPMATTCNLHLSKFMMLGCQDLVLPITTSSRPHSYRPHSEQGYREWDTARCSTPPLDPHNVHKMTSLEETATSWIPCSQCLIMVAMDLSRDVQFIKNELAEGNMTPAGSQGPGSATTHMFPIQLPIANEDDFNEAESLLKNESVRQKMIARLALVGGTNSENLIRRMLATALTNALACRYNWAGKKDKRCSSKKPFKETAIQDCMFAAARQFDRKLTHNDFSETVKKWLRYAPEREGGIPRNTSETNTSETSASPT